MDILLYTHNKGKINEFLSLTAQTHLRLHSAIDKKVHTGIEETGTTFIENAIIKARDGAKQSGMPCIADDSGLIVDCLGGKPGLYSARYAGKNANEGSNIEKLVRDTSHFPPEQRTARFYCCIVFLRSEDDPCPLIGEGSFEGLIIDQPVGNNGFGYDPIFYLPKLNQTAAQISPDEKHKLSHRGKALRSLQQQLSSLFMP